MNKPLFPLSSYVMSEFLYPYFSAIIIGIVIGTVICADKSIMTCVEQRTLAKEQKRLPHMYMPELV